MQNQVRGRLNKFFGIVAVIDQLMQPGDVPRKQGAKRAKKHYGRLTAEIVAYLNSVISVAVSRYYAQSYNHLANKV
jgi:hypothetical protein